MARVQGHGKTSEHRPELILNNFNTRLGHRIGRSLGALVPHDPEFHGRRVITFHNQRDFIFFRHHRYVFENRDEARLQELGPRFTLKLRRYDLSRVLWEAFIFCCFAIMSWMDRANGRW